MRLQGFSILSLLSLVYAAANVHVHGRTCTVLPLGGGEDDGPSILSAFAECGNGGKIVLDKSYTVGTVLVTTGLKNVEIELSGLVQYTPDIAYWSPNSVYLTYQNATTYWLLSGENIRLYGGGTLDANGQVWWDYPNKTVGTAGGSSTAFARPVPLTVANSSHVVVEDLNELASPFWNNFVYQSTHVTYRNITIFSVSSSSNPAANSDGWDIYRSSHVTIENSNITNDDDCVSFKPNTTNVIVNNLYCNGSHGISVGSLGQYGGETDIVANISVNNIYMANAQNGARIKVFGGSPYANSTTGGGTGYVKNVTYQNFHVVNVDNPITVNQCYDTTANLCSEYPSQLTISDVHFNHVYGTSSGKEDGLVVSLECSSICEDITATGTNLTSPDGNAMYICDNIASLSQLDFDCTAPLNLS